MAAARRILKWVGIALGALVLLVVAILAALQIGPIRRAAVEYGIEMATAGGPQTVTVRDVGGFIPFSIRLAGLSVADAQGLLLEAGEVALSWQPFALLTGEVHVDRIALTDVKLERLPPQEESSEPFSIELPQFGTRIAVDELSLHDLTLGPAVLGAPATLSLQGSLALGGPAEDAKIELKAARTDGVGGAAEIILAREPGSDALKLRIKAQEPAGGVVARLAGLPGLPPTRLDLDGSGPLTGWSGHLSAAAEGVAAVDADVRLGLGKAIALGLEGSAEIGGLVPPDLASAVPQRLDIAADLNWEPGARLAINKLALSAPGQSVAVSGTIDPAAGTLAATVDVDVADASWVERFAPGISAGAVKLAGTLGGTLQAPLLNLDATVAPLRAPRFFAERVELHLHDLSPQFASPDAMGMPQLVAGQADGTFEGLRVDLPGVDLGPLLAQPVEWSFAGTVNVGAGAADVQSFQASLGDLALFAAGTIDEGFSRVEAAVSLQAADIAALASVAKLPPGTRPTGSVSLDLDVSGTLAGPDLVATISGGVDDLTTGIPTSDALLKGHVAASGTVSMQGGTVLVDGLQIAGPSLRLKADGTYGETIDMAIAAELPDLRVLSAAMSAPMSGSIKVAATVKGTAAAPELRATVEGRQLAAAEARLAALSGTLTAKNVLADPDIAAKLVGTGFAMQDQSFDRVTIDLTAANVSARPQGRLALELVHGAEVVTARTDFDRPSSDTLRLSNLQVNGPGIQVGGEVRLAGGLASGRVTGAISDFAAFGNPMGVPLAGQASFAIDLANEKGRQSIVTKAEAKGLTMTQPDSTTASIERLSIEARVADAFRKPDVDVSVTLAEGKTPTTTVNSASVSVRGPLDALAFDVKAEGDTAKIGGATRQPLVIAVAGTAGLEGQAKTLRLDALDARYAGQSLKLLHPATAEWGGGRLEVRGFEAEAGGEGHLSADLSLARDAISAKIGAKSLPLSFVAAFSPGLDIAGTLDADVALSGTPAQPEGHAQVRFAGVRSGALEGVDVAALGGTVDATLRQGNLAATAKLDSPPGVTLTASLGAALALVPQPEDTAAFAVALDPNALLSGRVDGKFDLSLLPGMVDLAGDRVGGRLEAQLALSGTVSRPDVRGEARLVGASYESADLGTVVRNLDAEVEGDRSQVVIRKLAGSDGEGGKISATGALTLDAAGTFPFQVDGKLEHFLVLRRDEATVAMDGTIAVRRVAEGGTIDGGFTVRSAELRIPEAPPPAIVKLDVVEINPPAGLHRIQVTREAAARAAAAPPVVAAPWKLDIKVDLPGQVFVRGRGLDSEWRGKVQVAGTADSPEITGDLEAVRGTFNILERTLTVDRGLITFTGGGAIDPLLDIVTSAQVEGTKVQLAVNGTLSDPKLEATSDSGLPQDEVLALILFGKRLDTLSPVQAVQLAGAAASLTGSGPDVLDTVRRSVGLDFLGIQSTSDETTGEGGETGTLDSATLRAGKYITEDIFVHIDQGLTPESRRAGVEVRVLPETLPGVTVDSDVGVDSSSVGLKWKYDY